MVICLECDANDLHMVQLMLLPPYHLLLQYNPEWFTFLMPAYPGGPGKKLLNVCVCVCVCAFKLCKQTGRQTDRHTNHDTSYRAPSGDSCSSLSVKLLRKSNSSQRTLSSKWYASSFTFAGYDAYMYSRTHQGYINIQTRITTSTLFFFFFTSTSTTTTATTTISIFSFLFNWPSFLELLCAGQVPQKRTFGNNWHRYSWAKCSFCHSTKSVKQTTAWISKALMPGKIITWTIYQLSSKGRKVALFMPALTPIKTKEH